MNRLRSSLTPLHGVPIIVVLNWFQELAALEIADGRPS